MISPSAAFPRLFVAIICCDYLLNDQCISFWLRAAFFMMNTVHPKRHPQPLFSNRYQHGDNMNTQIVIGVRSNFSSADIYGMHRYRYQVFKNRLEWAVKIVGETEIDEFDDIDPVYMLLKKTMPMRCAVAGVCCRPREPIC